MLLKAYDIFEYIYRGDDKSKKILLIKLTLEIDLKKYLNYKYHVNSNSLLIFRLFDDCRNNEKGKREAAEGENRIYKATSSASRMRVCAQ